MQGIHVPVIVIFGGQLGHARARAHGSRGHGVALRYGLVMTEARGLEMDNRGYVGSNDDRSAEVGSKDDLGSVDERRRGDPDAGGKASSSGRTGDVEKGAGGGGGAASAVFEDADVEPDAVGRLVSGARRRLGRLGGGEGRGQRQDGAAGCSRQDDDVRVGVLSLLAFICHDSLLSSN